MASSTKEEFAQMIAQLEDSGQNAGVCIMAEMKKDRNPLVCKLCGRIVKDEKKYAIALKELAIK